MSQAESLFGRVKLGYLVVESLKRDEWQRFGAEGLGLHLDVLDSDTLAFRVDRHQRRIIVRNGPAEDVAAIGWQVADAAALQMALARLERIGIEASEGTAHEAALRGVQGFWSFAGPKRQQYELFVQPVTTPAPLTMRASGFVTGESGLGHLAITTRRPEAMQAFWRYLFDARLSDGIDDAINGIKLDFVFMRLNERHHSIATAATRGVRMDPLRTKIHHVNLQVASLDDVTEGYLRCRALGCKIANGIGQHPNDRELSFYVASPSGFEVELGWNPIVVHEDPVWKPAHYHGISLWGHFPESLTAATKLSQFGRSLLSLTRKEYAPEVVS